MRACGFYFESRLKIEKLLDVEPNHSPNTHPNIYSPTPTFTQLCLVPTHAFNKFYENS